jgi:hypothetical protein
MHRRKNMLGHSEKMATYKPRRETSKESNLLILGFGLPTLKWCETHAQESNASQLPV